MPAKLFSHMYWSLGKSLYNLDVQRRKKSANAVLKEIDLGIQIKYLEIGDPEKETIVIFHGFSDNKESFLHIALRLMNDYHLIIPDMPGFGENKQEEKFSYTIEQYSEWMNDFLNKIVPSKFHLIGHSMGGAIAAYISSEGCDRMLSLTILCGGGVITLPLVGFYKNLAEGDNLFSIKNKKDFSKFLNTNFHKKPFMPGSVKHFIYRRYADNYNWYNKIMNDLIGDNINHQLSELPDTALNDRLKDINVPTLVAWGEQDGLFPHDVIGQEYHRNIKNSQFSLIKDAGHCVNMEAPSKFSAVYRQFLSNLQVN
ncbi:alpha/beta fold hydrolase [Candidatus Uabimicrobium sp. HlEnr_7]|uniref:alpha/beta fold hydrolase n=1 Tax=Candidatus Uabimicrobium helgolandensis TaxID=3095367 RepID=UPI003558C5F3